MKKFAICYLLCAICGIAHAEVILLGAPRPTAREIAIVNHERLSRAAADTDRGVMINGYARDQTGKDTTGATAPDTDNGGIISVSLADPTDLTLESMLEGGVATKPDPIVLPFLQAYPIENIEVKFRLLNEKF